MSVFANVTTAPPDPILNLTTLFENDTYPRKANLGVGAYRDDDEKPYVLAAVKEAERRLLENPAIDKEYLPIDGRAEYQKLCQALLLGKDSPAIKENRVITAQSVSGTGALRVGAEFISKFVKETTIVIPDPTWANHYQIFGCYQHPIKKIRYFNPANQGLDFEGLTADIKAQPNKSVLVLHACAHNPTGIDPTHEQWRTLLQICKEKELIVFFDCAYQGYATGDLEADAYSMRLFVENGIECFIAQSFAKNFGLYGERAGTFSIVLKEGSNIEAVRSQMKIVIRGMYSSPPLHGSLIVSTILKDPELTALWKKELKSMADRIMVLRQKLYDLLLELKTPGDWSHILKHIGMFTFTGLSAQQCDILTKKYHIYMTTNGRISMTGLNTKNLKYVAQAINDVVVEARVKL
jgi:aspartate aminotransferase